MSAVWEKALVVALWMAFVLWFVRPEPGKGLPIGRRFWFWRGYLNRRQAVIWGIFLVVAGTLMALAGLGAESGDAMLMGFCLLWLGLPYVYHGLRSQSPSGTSLWDDLTPRVRPR